MNMISKPSGGDALYAAYRVLDRITNMTSKALIVPCVVTLVVLVSVFGVAITVRAVANVGWPFVEEFTHYWLVLVGSFALAYTLRNGEHIKVRTITQLLPKRVRSILAVIASLLAVAIVAYLTQKGGIWFWQGLETGVRSVYPSHVILWPVYLLVPVGLIFLGLELLRELCGSLIALIQDESEK